MIDIVSPFPSGGRYPGKTLVLELPGIKMQGILVRSETKIEVRNEDWHPGCLSQKLKIGMRPGYGDRNCFPTYPPGGRYPGKTLVLEISGGGGGGKCVRRCW